MTPEGSRIATLIRDGDYYEALGVRPYSTNTEIAETAARLAREHPDQARTINAVASVLRNPKQREIYEIAREERDNMVFRELAPQLREAIPEVRHRVWFEIQRLLQCQFELGTVNIGPRAARSLAQRYDWIREAVVNTSFLVVATTPAERRVRVTRRTLIFVQDCAKCGGAGTVECDCNDTYRFGIPAGAPPGELLGAYGERNGRIAYVILDRAVVVPRPYHALTVIFHYQGSSASKLGANIDFTLEEAQAHLRKVYRWLLVGCIALGSALGLFISSWLTGLAAALPAVVVFAAANASASPPSPARARVNLVSMLMASPVIGALAGSFLATVPSGLATGLGLSICVGFFFLMSFLLRRRLLT